jgi:hypothetical protein
MTRRAPSTAAAPAPPCPSSPFSGKGAGVTIGVSAVGDSAAGGATAAAPSGWGIRSIPGAAGASAVGDSAAGDATAAAPSGWGIRSIPGAAGVQAWGAAMGTRYVRQTGGYCLGDSDAAWPLWEPPSNTDSGTESSEVSQGESKTAVTGRGRGRGNRAGRGGMSHKGRGGRGRGTTPEVEQIPPSSRGVEDPSWGFLDGSAAAKGGVRGRRGVARARGPSASSGKRLGRPPGSRGRGSWAGVD